MLQLKPLPIQATHSLGPLFILVIAFIAFILDAQISDTLIYNRSLVDAGEVWRLITGHFFHSNANHFMLNAAAVVLLWALHGQYYHYKNYAIIFITSAVICSLGIHWMSLDIALYVGLSGVLHGFFVWGALMDIKHKEKTGYLLFIGVVLKIAHEQIHGASADVELLIGASVATDAHLYGAIGGLLAFLSLHVNNKQVAKETV
ncbi:rhombosortase [Colwellia sp. M166]|uniref:rhombosortase n=1 Tax=Colwellia sp. M166 TaxID=2583805 RepID=UPI00211DF37F|nr:rhombosortase [Colwellia sp. M166]UUO22477.1 rhombosortase [Colwellia sp. M166]|tara:strand:+ start:310 stop:918 length:609 start_codon:yes stop_codon:yes gene_type:complete